VLAGMQTRKEIGLGN